MAHWPDRESAVLERSVATERRSNLSPDECMGRYCALVKERRSSSRTRRKGGRPGACGRRLPSPTLSGALIANDRAPLRREDNPAMKTIRTTLGEFIDYMTTAGASSANRCTRARQSLLWKLWSPSRTHATLRSHISRPYFVPDDIPPDGRSSITHSRRFSRTRRDSHAPAQ